MIDIEAEVQALRERDEAWIRAGSVGAVAEFLTDDYCSFSDGVPISRGKQSKLEWYKNFYDNLIEEEGSPDRVEVAKSGDFGYTMGTAYCKYQGDKDAKPREAYVKYIILYRKENGVWKGFLGSNNTAPPPQPE